MKKENQLLSRIVKMVTGDKTPEAVVEATEQVTEAVEQAVETLTVKIDASEVQAEIEKLQAQVDAVTAEFGAKLEEAAAALAEMTAKFEAAQAELATLAAEKAEMVANARAVKLAARKEKVVAAIGTEKADGLMLATEGLDDAAFEAVVSALAGSVDAEAKTELFSEVGVAAEADAAKVVEESEEMKLLKQKYSGAN